VPKVEIKSSNPIKKRLPHYWFRISCLLLTSLFLFGCGRVPSSGIPEALNSQTPILNAGASQGLKLIPTKPGKTLEAKGHIEVQRKFYLKIASGTREKLLTDYQQEVERIIIHQQGRILEVTKTGFDSYARSVCLKYAWGQNTGVIQIDSSTQADGTILIDLSCYEQPLRIRP